MEKQQLAGLTPDDLWYFVRTRYIMNVSKSSGVDDLVDCILSWQARDLAAKADKAHEEWKGKECRTPPTSDGSHTTQQVIFKVVMSSVLKHVGL